MAGSQKTQILLLENYGSRESIAASLRMKYCEFGQARHDEFQKKFRRR